MPEHYPRFTASGSPRELGRQHGEQASRHIHGYLEFLRSALKLSAAEFAARTLRFEPLFRETCPHLLEEVAGLAEGARLARHEALALQLRGEIGACADSACGDGACTTFVISGRGTASGEPLIGQTSDTPAEIEEFGYVLQLLPQGKPELLMWTFGGMLGYHGVNAHGVAHFANALGGGPAWRFALSHYPLKRLILEQDSLVGVRGLLEKVPVCSNGNYVLCDGKGEILDVELTSAGPHLIEEQGTGFIAHSNHYLCAPYACSENFAQSLPDSFPRLERMQELIGAKFGSITLADVQQFLSDHSGFPIGICRHPHDGYGDSILPNTGKTVAAIIAEPAQGRLHVACGNPCERPFATHGLAGHA